MGQPGMGQPGMGQPGMGQPGMGQPGMGQPGMQGQPGMGQQSVPMMGPGGATGQMPQVKRMSAALWLILGPIMLLLGGILTAIGMTSRALVEVLFVSWIPFLVGGIFLMIFIYKIWAALNDGVTKPTPGAALGFMFIPIFSLYWLFVAYGSWGTRYNEFCQRHGIQSQAPAGLFLFWAISCFLGPLALIMTCIAVPTACGAINRIADSQQ